MLNPPLSLLSEDLFGYIVDHVAELPFPNEHLYNLSIADRAFTGFCQAHLFKVLYLGYRLGTKGSISRKLAKMKKILDDKPVFVNRVRMVDITISHEQNRWFFDNPIWISIVELLANSLLPPHKLRLSGLKRPFIFEYPISIVARLTQTFFSRTLTVLHLTRCKHVPLTLFLICPRLREIRLTNTSATWKSYDKYPDEQCFGRELPILECLDYCESQNLVEQMITPPPKFHTAVVLWSKLRVLTLSPHEKGGLACLQPILDAACNSLEELYLTNIPESRLMIAKQTSLARFVNLRDLSCLQIFALHAVIKCNTRGSTVLRDINLVLSTIPTFNKVTNLSFDLTIYGDYPFDGYLEEDWDGLCDEVVRISGGKPLGLNLEISISPRKSKYLPAGQDELYERIMERMASFSECPNICIDFWLPF